MSRIFHVNGAWVAEEAAQVSVLDRGFLFADAVYEVTAVLDGRLVDVDGHLARLGRSLAALGMALPAPEAELADLHREAVARNGLTEGMVYLQVTRGVAERDFLIRPGAAPGIVLFTQSRALVESPAARTGIRVVSRPDLRWGRRDIKTVQLLAASLAKSEAVAAGADDAWLVEADGTVTEGSSSNAWILTAEEVLVTRALSPAILPGITRAAVLKLAGETGLRLEVRAFSIAEARTAREAFVTAASSFVLPVISIDGAVIGEGSPGPVTRRLRELYIAEARAMAV